MFKIVFYKDARGKEPVKEAILEWTGEDGKSARIRTQKIADSLKVLELSGTLVGEPWVKHLSGAIWELRPLKFRILFFASSDGEFVLLHSFVKKSSKTPHQEIVRAENNMKRFLERNE